MAKAPQGTGTGRRQVAVLGCGLIGRLIVEDLAGDASLHVIAVDRAPEALELLPSGVERRAADLSRPASIGQAIASADAVVGALPGFLGPLLLEAVIDAGRPLVDISFSPDDSLRFDAAARSRGVPVIVDCGLAPGISNWLAGRETQALDTVESVLIFVGGLPVQRDWPFEYRVVFSPADVIEEYTRPCRFRERGVERVEPALSEVELVSFAGIGTLEAFLTDGLRTLLSTLQAPTLKEKTLRYPGHAERMRMLRETGFFGTDPVRVAGAEVVPRAVTEALMRKRLALQEGEADLALLRLVVEGVAGARRRRVVWELQDRADAGRTAMARTTAYPCALVARMLLDGGWSRPGVHPPEILGQDAGLTRRLLEGLEHRGVRPQRREEDG